MHTGKEFSTLTAATRIGLIGLGNVGTAIAKNLLKTDMILQSVFDTRPQAMDQLPSGIVRAGNARELAADCDVVLTALPTPASVKIAMEGHDGMLTGLREGSVWIDHSTTGRLDIKFSAALFNRSSDLQVCLHRPVLKLPWKDTMAS